MNTTSSESNGKLGLSGKGLVTSLGFNTKVRLQKLKRQGMPSEMSVRRTFRRLSKSLRKLGNYLMRRRGPNMSPLTDIFIWQSNLRSVWWYLINLIGTIAAVIRKWLLRLRTLILRTMTEQSFLYNRHDRANWVYHISLYTSQVALLDESICQWAHVWASSSHKVVSQFFQTLW